MIDLTEARAIAKARTAGPWRWMFAGRGDTDLPGWLLLNKETRDSTQTWILDGVSDGNDHMVHGRDEDRNFIAYFGTHADAILDELEALRKVAEAAIAYVEDVCDIAHIDLKSHTALIKAVAAWRALGSKE